MTVIRTSTGTVQEIATEDGPMTTAAGSRQMGVKDAEVVGATPITGADTYFYQNGSGMQEVSPVAGGGVQFAFTFEGQAFQYNAVNFEFRS